MSLLVEIDRNRPLKFTGHSVVEATAPALRELADEMGMPQILRLSEPLPGLEFVVEGQHVAEVLDWLSDSRWGERLEQDLQCMAEDEDRSPLLSTWVSFDEFVRFAEDATHIPALAALASLRFQWSAAGVDEVYLDGYMITDDEGRKSASMYCVGVIAASGIEEEQPIIGEEAAIAHAYDASLTDGRWYTVSDSDDGTVYVFHDGQCFRSHDL